jgi:hypothetical protein
MLEISTDAGASFPLRVGDTLRADGPAGTYVHTLVRLPEVSGEGNTIMLRWRVVPDSSGSNGTLRFDDILVERRLTTDLSVSLAHLLPVAPGERDTLKVVARVYNRGANGVSEFALQFAHDVNEDSLAQGEEVRVDWTWSGFLASGDSLDGVVSLGLFAPGRHQLILLLHCEGDQEIENNRVFYQVEVGLRSGGVVINEILYAPTGGEPEWLEIFNISRWPVNIEGWQLADGSAGSPPVLTSEEQIMESGAFLVLTGDSIAFAGVHPDARSAILPVPRLPLLNNTGDELVLYDRQLRQMDSLRYLPSWGGGDGRSLERVEPSGLSTSGANWGSSRDSAGSTPGRRNSIMRLEYDLLLDVELPVNLSPGTQGAIGVILRNVGRSPIDACELLLYHDLDGDASGEPDEFAARAAVTLSVAPSDSLVLPLQWEPLRSGRHSMILVASWEKDMRLANNTVHFTAEVSYPGGSISINEFLYEPLSGYAEFVELLNGSENPIDLKGWSVRDGSTGGSESRGFDLARQGEVVGPGELFLLSSDTSLFALFPSLAEGEVQIFVSGGSGLGLNNGGDSIILCDPTGRSVDSLRYDPSWHNPSILDHRGRSLEKVAPGIASDDARSWSTSLDPAGATPGMPNSLSLPLPPRHSRLSFAPNPFSPNNDGVDDFVIVHYEVPVPTAAVTLTVYDVRGRLIRRLFVAGAAAPRGDIVWDGRDEERGVARVGIYVVVLEGLDETGGTLVSAKGAVVLACRLE